MSSCVISPLVFSYCLSLPREWSSSARCTVASCMKLLIKWELTTSVSLRTNYFVVIWLTFIWLTFCNQSDTLQWKCLNIKAIGRNNHQGVITSSINLFEFFFKWISKDLIPALEFSLSLYDFIHLVFSPRKKHHHNMMLPLPCFTVGIIFSGLWEVIALNIELCVKTKTY